MALPILATKLYIPLPRPDLVPRPCLIERLNEGLERGCKLSLISAPAGFGKTTLVSEWLAGCGKPVAWLSLDEGDNDPTRFLTYFISALQKITTSIGERVLNALQSPQPPSIEPILTALVNEITILPEHFILVLDDYHLIDSKPVDKALTFLLEHLPQQMHLVIDTREDPQLPLARLRARGQLTELRAEELRFSPAEASEFLNRVMGLNLSAEDIAALETRTEGWIAGLQMAALSMKGRSDTTSFIQSFTGSHRFVLDYLVEEVLEKQSESLLKFMLRTSILERLCGPLCDAVLDSPGDVRQEIMGQKNLEYLARANLFTVPLDNDRHWYRYHHLFANLLRHRLGQSCSAEEIAELHIRASQWFENNDLMLEAFQHAAAAQDIDRAERLIETKAMGLHLRNVSSTILDWLDTLPASVLDARPLLRVRHATLSLMAWRMEGIEEKLMAAEVAVAGILEQSPRDAKARDLKGQIACARATLALTRYDSQTMLDQSRRALEYLHPENHTFLFTANWAFATANLLLGNRPAAAEACQQAIGFSQKSGSVFSRILATTTLGNIQRMDNLLYQAAEKYQSVMELACDNPIPNTGQVLLNLAEIYYEWNDLETAERYGMQSQELMRQHAQLVDRFILGDVFIARLQLARGDIGGASAILAETERSARQKNFLLRLPDVAAFQVLVLIQQDQLAKAEQLARQYDLLLCQARVLIAQNDPSAALVLVVPLRHQMESRGWADELLKTMVIQAIALHLCGKKEQAEHVLGEALVLAEPGGFLRTFLDEGDAMRSLIEGFSRNRDHPMSGYARKILAAFAQKVPVSQSEVSNQKSTWVESLSQRELKILQLIAQGLSNGEISERLFLALSTVKGHNRNIFDKLQVQSRTEAVARARELGLL